MAKKRKGVRISHFKYPYWGDDKVVFTRRKLNFQSFSKYSPSVATPTLIHNIKILVLSIDYLALCNGLYLKSCHDSPYCITFWLWINMMVIGQLYAHYIAYRTTQNSHLTMLITCIQYVTCSGETGNKSGSDKFLKGRNQQRKLFLSNTITHGIPI